MANLPTGVFRGADGLIHVSQDYNTRSAAMSRASSPRSTQCSGALHLQVMSRQRKARVGCGSATIFLLCFDPCRNLIKFLKTYQRLTELRAIHGSKSRYTSNTTPDEIIHRHAHTRSFCKRAKNQTKLLLSASISF